MIACADIFSGVGGLSSGLRQSGVDVRIGVDIDPQCEKVYELNTGVDFLRRDVARMQFGEVAERLEDANVRLLAGCAPCQPFSTYGRTRKQSDNQWRLLSEFGRAVKEIQPELVTMENVPGLAKHKVFFKFTRDLKALGYSVSWEVLKCEHYGVPQSRRRLVLIASLLSNAVLPLPLATDLTTVRDTISELPPLEQGEADEHDPLHVAAGLSKLNLKRIRASVPGGSWRDWPKRLVSTCHTQRSGKTYPSVYGRMSWDLPSPTITTQCYGYGNGRFGHPEQDRAISLREAALLQSFPPHWTFAEAGKKVQLAPIGRMIGNAVPPKLGEVIGRQLIASVT